MPAPENQDATDKVVHEMEVKGSQLTDKVREIVEEGNARRIIIRKDDRTLLEVPLSVGAGAATAAVLLSPVLAAVGAVGALMSDVNVIVERRPEDAGTGAATDPPPPPKPSA